MKEIPNFKGYFATEEGEIYSQKWGHLKKLKPIKGRNQRYWTIRLNPFPMVTKWLLLHRVILETFVGPCPKGMVACHGENGRDDNSIKNLRWATHKENMGHDRWRDGTIKNGIRNNTSKLSESQIKEIRKLQHDGLLQRQVASMFGINRSYVGALWANQKRLVG